MAQLSKEEFFQRYDIDIRDGRLGGGAFGTVYKAWDNLKDEWKAIKIAEVKIINGKEFSLISEFDATKRLPIHKNIINYESVHTFAMPNGMFDYAVMQYYPHGNLKQLSKSEKLNQQHKIELIIGLFRGLEVLHTNGVKHRDLKPSNILISERKGHFTPKIADFGLAKYTNDGDLSAVTNSFGGGTLEYSSPEQLLGEPLRDNTDIWAVGVMAYELFVGHIPFVASNDSSRPEVRRRTISQNIVNAAIPPEIQKCPQPYQDIITKCLIKDPALRIKSAQDVLNIIGNEPFPPVSAKMDEVKESTLVEEGTIIISVEDQLKSEEVDRLKIEEEIQLQKEIEKAKEEQLEKERQKLIEEERAAEEKQRLIKEEIALKLKEKEALEEANRLKKEALEREKKEKEALRQMREKQKAAEQAEKKRLLLIKKQEAQRFKEEKDKKEKLETEKRLKQEKRDEEKRLLLVKKKEEEARKIKEEKIKKEKLATEKRLREKAFREVAKKKKIDKKRKEEKKRKEHAKNERNGFVKRKDKVKRTEQEEDENNTFNGREKNKAKVVSVFGGRKWKVAAGALFLLLSVGGFKIVQYAANKTSSIVPVVDIQEKSATVQLSDNGDVWLQVLNADSMEKLLEIGEQNSYVQKDERYKAKEIELIQKEDSAEWKIATGKNTVASYSKYIEDQPKGLYIIEANTNMNTLLELQFENSDNIEKEMFESAMRSGQVAQIEYFIDKYSNGKYAVRARKKLVEIQERNRAEDWNIAKSLNTVSSYQDIIKKYPNSTVAKQANDAILLLLDSIMKGKWKQIESSNDVLVFQDFETKYPNSKYSNLIKDKVRLLNKEEALEMYKDSVNLLLKSEDIGSLKSLLGRKINYKRNEIERRIAELNVEDKPVENDSESKINSDDKSTVLSAIVNNMIRIPGGSFSLGCSDDCNSDNTPQVTTTVAQFYLAKYEVTQEEYEAVMGDNPSTYDDCEKCPVENVSYYDAEKYVNRLNEISGKNYRLPTEEEWEYAAKAGKEYQYSGSDDIIKVGVYKSNSNNGTQRRGSKSKNSFGLFDMTGNVHEWCSSQYTEDGYGEDNKASNNKVIRGGSWRSKSSDCKVVNRGKSAGSVRNSWTGFRLASD